LINTITNTINEFKKFTTTNDDNFSHLTPEDKNGINEECSKIETWLNNLIHSQTRLNLYDDPVLLSNDLIRKNDQLFNSCNAIKFKPKPKTETKKEEKEEKKEENKEKKENKEEKKRGE